jgi:hypothetical protein
MVNAYIRLFIEKYTFRAAFYEKIFKLSSITPEQNTRSYVEAIAFALEADESGPSWVLTQPAAKMASP